MPVFSSLFCYKKYFQSFFRQLSCEKSKTNSYCAAGCHNSFVLNIGGDMTKTGWKLFIGKWTKSIRSESKTFCDITVAEKGLE